MPSSPEQPTPKGESPRFPRREFIKDSLALGAVAVLLRLGEGKSKDSPMVIFFMADVYSSPHVPRIITLTPEQISNGQASGIGTSLVYGQDGVSPVKLTTESMTDGKVGIWTPDVVAISGSSLNTIPEQLQKLKHVPDNKTTQLVITDGAYNTVTEKLLADKTASQDLTDILDRLEHFSWRHIGDVPKLIGKLNEVCDAFLYSISQTKEELAQALYTIFSTVKTPYGIVYKWPPLDKVNALQHIATRDIPGDKNFTLQIAGDPMKEALARRISILGSNMTEQATEKVVLHSTIQAVPLDLPLRREHFANQPFEHPNIDGYKAMAAAGMTVLSVNGETIWIRLGKKVQ